MSTSVEVEGAAALQASLAVAARKVEDMEAVNAEVAGIVASAVRAPRRTGRLAGSVQPSATKTEAAVGSDLVYAPVIHNGWPAHHIAANPFIADAFAATQTATEDAYGKWAQGVLDDVKGA